jgi:hypothetical protein
MNKIFYVNGVRFEAGGYTPRNNEFEKGLKYRLFVDDWPTELLFSTLKELKEYAQKYWALYK